MGTGLSDEDMDIDTMITTYNTAVKILGKECRRKKPWVTTKDVLHLCDDRRDLKKKRYEAEGAKEYREANRIQKAVKKAKEDWICAQCEEIETCLNKNNSKRAYQLVKDLTSEKQGRSSAIQDKSGKCLTEELENVFVKHYAPNHMPDSKGEWSLKENNSETSLQNMFQSLSIHLHLGL